MRSSSKILTPAIALALSLLLTFGAAFFAYSNSEAENYARFDRTTANFVNALKSRMQVYSNALLYTRNLFDLKPDLNAADFHQFVSRMGLKENYPGIQTLGYVEVLDREQTRRALRGFRITPEYAKVDLHQNEFAIVKFVERLYPAANNVLGVNLGGSPERKMAMDRARDLGQLVATERVFPMFANANDRESAFLVFVPRYRQGVPLDTVEQRRAALMGFVYGGFRANNLFARVSDLLRSRRASFMVEIFDGEGYEPGRLMYVEGDPKQVDMSLQKDLTLDFANHLWSLRLTAPIGFTIPNLRWAPVAILALGVLLSLAIALALRRSQNLAEELRAANQAKSIFLANISHEIRTPLGAMIGFAELALNQEKSERETSLKTVVRNGKQLTRIIGDVLDLAKIEAKSLVIENHPCSLRGIFNDLVATWRPQMEGKGLRLDLDLDQSLPERIMCDESRVKQILTNMLSNAYKFTEQGFVKIEARKVASASGTAQLRMTVWDSGVGVAESFKDKLFIPFSQGDDSITRRFGGSGLGLALSRQIAEAMNGDLKLSEESGEPGTGFVLTLPLVVAESEPAEGVNPAADAGVLTGRNVLLVEDSEDNQALITLMLRRSGAHVQVAGDGKQGVECALTGQFDVILMDIQMPVLDGYGAVSQLRDAGSKTPVIALTAHALREERDRALKSGFNEYVTKPIDRVQLIRAISSSLS